MEDEGNQAMAYTTHEDIAACFPGDTVLAVRVGDTTILLILLLINILLINTLLILLFSLTPWPRPPRAPSWRCPGRRCRWAAGGSTRST